MTASWSMPRAQLRDQVSGDALEDAVLRGRRHVDQELLDPGIAVAPDHLLEGVDRGERVARHHRRPAVERAADRARVAADRVAGLVEAGVALAHLVDAAERIPTVAVLRDDPEHARPVGAEGERRPRALDRAGAEDRLSQLVVPAIVADDVGPQQPVDDLDRLAVALDQPGRLA